MQRPSEFYIPDIMASWPWTRTLSPHFHETWEASRAWFLDFKLFTPREIAIYDACHIGLLSALTYALSNKEIVRSGCDLMSIFLIFDEYSDREDEKGVRALANLYMNVFRNPTKPRPQGEPIVGEIVRQFWGRARKGANPRYQQRFVDAFQEFTEAVVQQAKDRHSNHLRTADEYFAVRRGTVGLRPTLPLILFDTDYDIPDQVFDHPVMVELEICAIDSIITSNDIASYNREQARGDDTHNLVTIVMHQYQIGLQDALQWIAQYQEDVTGKFIELRKRLPLWGEDIDNQVQRYLDSVACWVRGNDSWDWECERYFGKDGLKVKEGAPVILLPKKMQ